MACNARANLGDFRIQEESTYMGSPTGSEYYVALQDSPGEEGWVPATIPDETMRYSVFDSGVGPKTGLNESSVSIVCKAGGAPSPVTSSLSADSDHTLLASMMGAGILQQGDETVSNCTTELLKVDSATGFSAGGFVMVSNEVAIITDVSGTDITITPALSGAPADGVTVYGSFCVYCDDTDRDTWRVEYHKEPQEGAWRVKGFSGVPTWSQLGPGEGGARVTIEGEGGTVDPITSDLSSAVAADTFTLEGPVAQNCRLVITDGSTTLTPMVNKFEVVTPMALARLADSTKDNSKGCPSVVMGEGAINMTLGQATSDADPVDQLRTWIAAGTRLQVFYQLGNQPGDALAFYFPSCYVKEYPVPAEVEGLFVWEVSMKISQNLSGDLTSPMYVGRL